jgi:hypothetical protein
MNVSSEETKIRDAGLTRLRELEQLADEKLANQGANSMKVASTDPKIQGKKEGDVTDTRLKDIPSKIGDQFCPPCASGAGTGKTTAPAATEKLS